MKIECSNLVFCYRTTLNRKQGEKPEETWEIPKETGEAIDETRGNVWGNGGNM